ncbi:uncharacterized protein LY89DRAFT_185285 [Mollisia scopiformis]|uniref:Uncharacterized protein n=1 Tax=Mollisia scopiformis TaxID=149040 RepID=A0A194XU28_MOLSC|nr:uncharacterized protein LY89DRAFT_185285 [Mollisia scopiformis]KUJ23539.1 hypothetical protein LY89DRAFT_185285 [Mollisia scopiformis]
MKETCPIKGLGHSMVAAATIVCAQRRRQCRGAGGERKVPVRPTDGGMGDRKAKERRRTNVPVLFAVGRMGARWAGTLITFRSKSNTGSGSRPRIELLVLLCCRRAGMNWLLSGLSRRVSMQKSKGHQKRLMDFCFERKSPFKNPSGQARMGGAKMSKRKEQRYADTGT